MKKLTALLTMILLAAPLFAQKIAPGYDTWKTVGNGETFMDFSDSPIPAGFFFEGSEPFTGAISFVGVPLATEPAGALQGTDTIIERMDTAAFDEDGLASSRMRIMALSLASPEPIDIDGSLWDVGVSLAEVQPITEIVYEKLTEDTGEFLADLVVNVRLTFTHRVVKKLSYSLERTVHFQRATYTPFRLVSPEVKSAKQRQSVLRGLKIDTDGDGLADSLMPLAQRSLLEPDVPMLHTEYCENGSCTPAATVHTAPLHQHTTTATLTSLVPAEKKGD